MRFDENLAKRYEAWFKTESGQVALRCEKALVEYLISPWPRRNQRLLEVGCGPGFFLDLFWRSGFDVTGIDPAPAMIAAARRRLGKNADLLLGHAEHLPCDDKEYDYVTLITTLEFCTDPRAAMAEAVRVARKGVLIGFLNRRSLYYLSHGKNWPWSDCKGLLRQACWHSWTDVWDLFLAEAGPRPFRARSVLPGPAGTWRNRAPWRQLNTLLYPARIGAFAAVRFDLVDDTPLTPIMAWKTEPRTSS